MARSISVPISHDKNVIVWEPERGQFANNLGGAVEYSLAHHIFKILEITGGGIGAFAGGFLVHFLEIIEPELVDYLAPLLDEILDTDDLPPRIREYFEGIRHPEGQAGAAILAGLGSSAGGTAVSSLMGALMAKPTQALNKKLRPSIPAVNETLAMRWRGFISGDKSDEWLQKQGWPDEAIVAFQDIIRPRSGVGDLFQLWLRGRKTLDEVEDELRKRGYTDDDIRGFKYLTEVIPGVQDLIRFMVRDVFHPDVVAKYGYDLDFPTEVTMWTRKLGLSDDWAKAYWRAHWELPSPEMAAEMVHRAGLSEAEFKELLRINDYAPFWIDYFTKLIYTPYNRVDVRRMYSLGVLSKDEVKKAYKELGYDDEKAQNLTDFTVREYGENAREATKSEIISAYKIGLLSSSEATAALEKIKYPDELIKLDLAKADYDREISHVRKVTSAVGKLYRAGRISQSEASQELGKLNLPGEMQSKLFEEWDWEAKAKVAIPSRTILEKWYKLGIIGSDEFHTGLKALGYDDKAIANFERQVRKEAAG